jgi:hypothetical protein
MAFLLECDELSISASLGEIGHNAKKHGNMAK